MDKFIFPVIAGIGMMLLLAAFTSRRPSLFVVGDSISIQYGPYLKKFTENRMDYARKTDDGQASPDAAVPEDANGGDSKMVLAYLTSKLADENFRPDYLLINCGLHDIKRKLPEKKLQVPPENYRENLTAIFDLAKAHGIRAIWVRTTPVVDSIHNTHSTSVHRHAEDLALYNQIADTVTRKSEIPVIDLYDFTQSLGPEVFADHVHYDEQTRALQAAFIAGNLRRIMTED